MVGIYKIENKINGKSYIGSTVNFKKRFSQHKTSLNRGGHHSPILQNSWDKHGEMSFTFEILEECREDLLIIREQFYIDTFKPEYNIAPNAGGTRGIRYSDEVKLRMKMARDLAGPRFHSEETKERLSKYHTGLKHSEETKEKIRVARTGSVQSEETVNKRVEKTTGKRRSDETKKLMSEIKMGNKNPCFGKVPWNKGKKMSDFGLTVWNKGKKLK